MKLFEAEVSGYRQGSDGAPVLRIVRAGVM